MRQNRSRFLIMVSVLCLAAALFSGCARKKAEVAEVVKTKRTAEISEVRTVMDKIMDMPFGASVSAFPALVRYKNAGAREYYYDPNAEMTKTRKMDEPSLIYVFEEGKLIGAIAVVNHVRDFGYALDYFEEQFGRSRMDRQGSYLVYLFDSSAKKVKVKVHEPTGRMKIGVYAKGDAETEPGTGN